MATKIKDQTAETRGYVDLHEHIAALRKAGLLFEVDREINKRHIDIGIVGVVGRVGIGAIGLGNRCGVGDGGPLSPGIDRGRDDESGGSARRRIAALQTPVVSS